MSDAAVTRAYAYCHEVTRRSGSSFAQAFRLLGPERRAALDAVYAFCRFVDDVADGLDAGARDPAALLARWREEIDRVYAGTATHPIGIALADAARRFALPQRHFTDLIRGVEMDLSRRRYATFDELEDTATWSPRPSAPLHRDSAAGIGAVDYARDLGVAFQLTNILRDVREDGARGRLYLPLEDLARFGCDEDELLAGHYSARVGALMAFECGRARAYYLRASGSLAPEDRRALAPAEAMRWIYERLLARIESRRFDVFHERIALPRYERVGLALAAWGRAQLPA